MTNNMKVFLAMTVSVCHLGVGLLVGYHYGSQHGYAAGKYDMIQWCESYLKKKQEKKKEKKESSKLII